MKTPTAREVQSAFEYGQRCARSGVMPDAQRDSTWLVAVALQGFNCQREIDDSWRRIQAAT